MAVPVMTKPATQKSSLKAPSKNWLTLAATESPTEFKQTGLPAGLSLNVASGLITGSPTAAVGNYTVEVWAKNASGEGAKVSFEWKITAEVKITKPINQTSKEGVAISPLVVSATGTTPLTWSAVTLPEGLNINVSTGEITGTPSKKEAKHAVELKVSSIDGGTATTTFEWTVEVSPPTVNIPEEQFSYLNINIVPLQILATGEITEYKAENVPLGLTMSGLGLFTGIPTESGEITVKVKVIGPGGTSTLTFVWKILNAVLPKPTVGVEYNHIAVFN